MLPQVPSESGPQPQTWAAIATAVAGALAVFLKKRFGRTKSLTAPAKLISHAEFQSGLDAMRDRVTAGYMAMAEKFDSNQKEILAAIGTQGTAIEKRLDALESTVARLDERTKNS